jgi:formylglycine-generating enzyme required for sulfatase activity
MAGPRVFISHSPADSAFCHALVSDLRAAGADVWYDERDLEWDELRREMDRELPIRPYFVVVLSPEAVTSNRVGLTVDTARELMRTREVRQGVAVVARACQIPPAMSGFRRLDATAGIESVRAGLLAALGLTSGGSGEAALVPVRQASPAAPRTRERTVLPPRLDQLGFSGWRVGDVDLIVPPLSLVPAGLFQMGSHEDRNEEPVHIVTLPVYAIGTFPVLVAEYACFVRAGHALPADLGRVTWNEQFSRLDHPVVNVTWQDAVAYADWLSRWTGQPWRLATEAEWEKAARWDPASGTAREYPWGNQFDSTRCNTRESTLGGTTPAGIYPNGASPCGAQDMAGNVREWTSSLYQAYPYDPHDGRERAEVIGERVQRGGSWFGFGSDARAAMRDWHAPDDVSAVVGFRLALDAPADAPGVRQLSSGRLP